MVTRFKCVLFCFLKELNINPLVYIALNLASKAPWWLQPPLHSDHKHFMRKSGRDNRETSLPFEGPDSRNSTQSSDSLVSSSWEQSLRDSLQRWASYYYYYYFLRRCLPLWFISWDNESKNPYQQRWKPSGKAPVPPPLPPLAPPRWSSQHLRRPLGDWSAAAPICPTPTDGKTARFLTVIFQRPTTTRRFVAISRMTQFPPPPPPFSSFKYKPMIQPLPITSMTRSRRRRVRLLLPPTPQ